MATPSTSFCDGGGYWLRENVTQSLASKMGASPNDWELLNRPLLVIFLFCYYRFRLRTTCVLGFSLGICSENDSTSFLWARGRLLGMDVNFIKIVSTGIMGDIINLYRHCLVFFGDEIENSNLNN